jgi:hypothetical protein
MASIALRSISQRRQKVFTRPLAVSQQAPKIQLFPNATRQRPLTTFRQGIRTERGMWSGRAARDGRVPGGRLGRVGVSTAPPSRGVGGRGVDGAAVGP